MIKPGTQYPIPMSHKNALEAVGFSVGKVINAGSYGYVCDAKKFKPDDKEQQEEIAVKILELDKKSDKYVHHFLPKELKAIESLKHQSIIITYNITLKDNTLYIFMEKALGGDLLNMLEDNRNGIPEAKSKSLYRGVAKALKYIHEKGFAHRDVKCENILLVDRWRTVAKLTDFGASTACYEPQSGRRLLSDTYTGTRNYTAPEIYKKCPYDAMKSDVFSLGVVLYMMVNNEIPFTDKQIIQSSRNGTPLKLRFKNTSLSKDLVDLIDKQLCADVSKRPTMAKVVEHKWLK